MPPNLRGEQYDKRGVVMFVNYIVKSVAIVYSEPKSRYKTYWQIKFGGSLKKLPTAKFNSLSYFLLIR